MGHWAASRESRAYESRFYMRGGGGGAEGGGMRGEGKI